MLFFHSLFLLSDNAPWREVLMGLGLVKIGLGADFMLAHRGCCPQKNVSLHTNN